MAEPTLYERLGGIDAIVAVVDHFNTRQESCATPIFDMKIPPEVFDEVDAELGRSLDHFNMPEREKGEILAALGGQ